MWVVFAASLFIAFLWATKMILMGRFEIRRTPLDIPIALFLLSQIISTIISIDPHTSLWGYYSRFNGGLFSTISYIFLYYAFATNLIRQPADKTENEKPISLKLLVVSLISGLAVVLWGIPSHFGYDPTCLLFRGVLDTACWSDQFQPTVRIFSTLGQPNWMGTFLAVLIPIALGLGLYKLKEAKNKILTTYYMLLAALFYVALLWTGSQSSFLGLTVSLIIFASIFIYLHFIKSKQKVNFSNKTVRFLIVFAAIFTFITISIGTPIELLSKYATLSGFSALYSKPPFDSAQGKPANSEGLDSAANVQLGGTESSKIRLIVWQGAIELFKRNPLFGTGVETYAYAYYSVKPLAHNLTSEWDYLYNKAHNEYLNYLATTGIFGLGAYLAIIILFLYLALKSLLKVSGENANQPISIGIISGFIALLVSNFFGFSVVILNLFFFLFPLFFLELTHPQFLSSSFTLPKTTSSVWEKPDFIKMTAILVLVAIFLYSAIYLVNFWFADRKYALGYNLNKAGEFIQANTYLTEASDMLPGEDLYRDELSINLATLAVLLAQQNEATRAGSLAQTAKSLSDEIVAKHPNHIVYLKTRARVAFALAQIDPSLIDLAIKTLEDTQKLAPTDAKLLYSLALFYNQKGDSEKTIKYMGDAIKLKPNYLDAYYALALFYSQQGQKNPQRSIKYNAHAREKLEYILKNIDPTHTATKELLEGL